MNKLKKIAITLLSILFIILVPFSANVKIRSQSILNIYKRVINGQTLFYEDEKLTSPLFYLPYTYYVKVLSEENGVSHIMCYGDNNVPAIDGYATSSELFFDNQEVVSPYLAITITTQKSAPLYLDKNKTQIAQYIFANRSLYYYGSIQNDDKENLFFVSYNGTLGYIFEDNVYPFSVSLHPNELTFISEEDEEENKEQTPQNTDTLLKTIIICTAILILLFSIIFIFSKKEKPTTSVGYFDENDFE